MRKYLNYQFFFFFLSHIVSIFLYQREDLQVMPCRCWCRICLVMPSVLGSLVLWVLLPLPFSVTGIVWKCLFISGYNMKVLFKLSALNIFENLYNSLEYSYRLLAKVGLLFCSLTKVLAIVIWLLLGKKHLAVLWLVSATVDAPCMWHHCSLKPFTCSPDWTEQLLC